ncbi:hypothetical protein [Olleya namhaensis]|jgi:hypothetical protein|uniref:hypothetical protein n=1 Tax=Olleya TaxID=336276 RepID=UPI00232BF7E8|nr:hypothetical protein [Olleya namhaensis]|tara:strand:+ start:339 stop:959 length:621 start_codon:yes stop_codon:yes gene_type:complete
MTIQQLQALDMSNVQPEALQTAVQDILDDYKETNDKKAFEEIAKENIEKVFLLVERLAPNAIKAEKAEKKESKETSKKELSDSKKDAPKKDKEPTKTVKKELDSLSKDIKACRLKIKRFNEEKRKNEPKKPKPMRHTKIKNHFIAIANLIPPVHKDNVKMQKEAEKILLRAHRGIMNTYGINFVRAEAGEKDIKAKYDKMEEKATK